MHSRYTTNRTEVTLNIGDDDISAKGAFAGLSLKHHIQRPMRKLETKSDIIRGFSPAWFTATMGTGAIASLTYSFPYSNRPLEYIGMGIGLFNIILYIVCLVLFAARLIKYRDMSDILLHPQLSMSLGTIPMGLCTVVSGLVTMLSRYNTTWVPTFALVLWCIVVAASVLCSLIVPFVVISHQKYTLETMNAVLLLPVVPNVVAASTGGVVASAFSGGTAIVIILISYVLWGMGMLLAMMLTAAYLIRLVLYKLPPKEAMASAFIPIGPLGQSSYGIQILGTQALRVFSVSMPQVKYLGDVLHTVGFMIGLLLWGAALWWFVHAACSAIYTLVHERVPFNLGWWALIFPSGTVLFSTNALWNTTGYAFFRVLSAVLTTGLAIVWVCVLLNTVVYAWTGELFKPSNISRLELAGSSDNSDGPESEEYRALSEVAHVQPTDSPVSGITRVLTEPAQVA
ncbi:Plasma membrane sulfite pump involved in sulfite metabolism [Coemansia sp. RSA 1722]|nr:Plasma membrane sulfite pump involved in sulfite metabolism [Coemansia sp. RSA 486]KAJ2233970.1 Plasma membrane sulfite pump involved in sulfite metabolism [Coemansia sp. RSA 485]KAJ2594790.1 Plasma membrane sulfite pump involved in sulfite metabolism [Coemansia sp. RSA 1722]